MVSHAPHPNSHVNDLKHKHSSQSFIKADVAIRLPGGEEEAGGWWRRRGGEGGQDEDVHACVLLLSCACSWVDRWSRFNHDHHWWRGGVTPLWVEYTRALLDDNPALMMRSHVINTLSK